MFKMTLINNKKILYLFLFLIVFSYFLWLNTTASFPDPDSFYHAKITQLISQQGIIQDFNWLPFTTLNEVYIDHHLLYHLILIPLILLIQPLLAVKLAAVFFAAIVILSFQWLLDKFKIRYSFIYTLVLLLSHQLIFRINLAKVPALSLIVLLFFLYLLFSNKYKWSWPLFFLSFTYVWLYGGWPIMLGIAIIYWLMSSIYKWLDNNSNKLLDIIKHVFNKDNLKLLLNTLAGLIAGLVINPYFPTNLKFYWQQTFQIGLVNYKEIIGVGGEWYGMNLFDLISYQLPVFILLIVSLVLFFIYLKKQTPRNWTILLTSLIFFVLTLKSQRNIEYFIPFSLLFSALVINTTVNFKNILFSKKQIKHFISRYSAISLILIICLAIYLPITLYTNFKSLKDNLRKNYTFNQFIGISNWFKANTQPGDIIFHDDWDDWPVLFYHNSYNKYIVGLDPTFMYFKNRRRYWEWRNISSGKTEQDICQTVKNKFYSNHIFVKFDNPELKENLDLDTHCHLVYEDQDGWIYQVEF